MSPKASADLPLEVPIQLREAGLPDRHPRHMKVHTLGIRNPSPDTLMANVLHLRLHSMCAHKGWMAAQPSCRASADWQCTPPVNILAAEIQSLPPDKGWIAVQQSAAQALTGDAPHRFRVRACPKTQVGQLCSKLRYKR